MYGEHSSTCNIQRVCESLPLLHSAGLCVDIRQYPCADDLLSNMLSDANGWMMEQVTNQPAVEQTASAELFSEN
jgi:phospholipase/carboxylesterase